MSFFETPTPKQVDSAVRVFSALEDERGISSAIMLSLTVWGGVELNDSAITEMSNDMADLAEEHNLSPEEVQSILFHHEPLLRSTLWANEIITKY